MLSVFSLPWWTLAQINLYLPRINVFKIHLRILLAKIKGVANLTGGIKNQQKVNSPFEIGISNDKVA